MIADSRKGLDAISSGVEGGGDPDEELPAHVSQHQASDPRSRRPAPSLDRRARAEALRPVDGAGDHSHVQNVGTGPSTSSIESSSSRTSTRFGAGCCPFGSHESDAPDEPCQRRGAAEGSRAAVHSRVPVGFAAPPGLGADLVGLSGSSIRHMAREGTSREPSRWEILEDPFQRPGRRHRGRPQGCGYRAARPWPAPQRELNPAERYRRLGGGRKRSVRPAFRRWRDAT